MSALSDRLGGPGGQQPPVQLLHACWEQDLAAAQVRLSAGDDVNHRWAWDRIALHYAAHAGHTGLVNLFIDAGAELSARDWDGSTPLMMAASAGRTRAAMQLVRAGAARDVQSSAGNTALHLAMAGKHFDCVRALLWAGATAGIKNDHGLTCEDTLPLTEQPLDLVHLFRVTRRRISRW